jgi:hypothetical protein
MCGVFLVAQLQNFSTRPIASPTPKFAMQLQAAGSFWLKLIVLSGGNASKNLNALL